MVCYLMKIVAVVGICPQFIKATPVSKALLAVGHQEFLVHTGQNYTYNWVSGLTNDDRRICF